VGGKRERVAGHFSRQETPRRTKQEEALFEWRLPPLLFLAGRFLSDREKIMSETETEKRMRESRYKKAVGFPRHGVSLERV